MTGSADGMARPITPLTIKRFDLTLQLDEQRVAFAIKRLAGGHLHPAFTDAVLRHVTTFFVIEANADVMLKESFWGQSPNSPSLRLARRAWCNAPQRNWCLTPITQSVDRWSGRAGLVVSSFMGVDLSQPALHRLLARPHLHQWQLKSFPPLPGLTCLKTQGQPGFSACSRA